MSSPKHCPFCDNSQSFRFITETPAMRVVYPRNPAIAYHLLITPKRHVRLLDALTLNEQTELFVLLQRLTAKGAAALGKAYLGFNVLSNNGDESINQRVPHAHLHIFIRSTDDASDPFTSPHAPASMEFTEMQLQDLATVKSWFSGADALK